MSKVADLRIDMMDYAVKQLKKKLAKSIVADNLIKKFADYFKGLPKVKDAKKEAMDIIKDAIEDMNESDESMTFMKYLESKTLKEDNDSSIDDIGGIINEIDDVQLAATKIYQNILKEDVERLVINLIADRIATIDDVGDAAIEIKNLLALIENLK